jgi:hypothetical protein
MTAATPARQEWEQMEIDRCCSSWQRSVEVRRMLNLREEKVREEVESACSAIQGEAQEVESANSAIQGECKLNPRISRERQLDPGRAQREESANSIRELAESDNSIQAIRGEQCSIQGERLLIKTPASIQGERKLDPRISGERKLNPSRGERKLDPRISGERKLIQGACSIKTSAQRSISEVLRDGGKTVTHGEDARASWTS